MRNGKGDDGTHDGEDPSARVARNVEATRAFAEAAGAEAAIRESERERLVDEVKFKAESATKVLRYLEAAGTPGGTRLGNRGARSARRGARDRRRHRWTSLSDSSSTPRRSSSRKA